MSGCVARFCGGPTHYRGVACEVHWEVLTPEAQTVLDAWISERRPRGGCVRTIPEALFAVAGAGDGIVRREWAAFLRQDVLDGMYDDHPDVVAAVLRRPA